MFHFDAVVQEMIINGIWETLYMTLASTFMGYVLGLPLGIALAVTDKTGIRPQPVVYRVLDVISNVLRSIPFIILLILVIPLTRFIRGAVLWLFGYSRTTGYRCRSFYWTYGGIIAQGSRSWRDRGCSEHGRRHLYESFWKVLLVEARTSLIVGVTIALGTILGYSAMAGAVGGGGLGNIAIRYGYYRYQPDIMIVTIVILIVLVQILQGIGMLISAKLDRRK